MSKMYVNMRAKTSEKGNSYLGGYSKIEEAAYFINKSKEGANRLSKKLDNGSEFIELGELSAREGDFGPYEFVVNGGKVYTLSASRTAGEPLVGKDGNPILDREGKQVIGAPFVLVIKDDQPKG